MTMEEVDRKNKEMSKKRSEEVKSKVTTPTQWNSYPQDKLESPMKPESSDT